MKKHHPFFLLLLALTGCQVQPSLPTVPEFELSRYLGKWYETARLDHSFERGMSEVSAHYSLNEDGTVKVINSGIRDGKRRSITGVAKTTNSPIFQLVINMNAIVPKMVSKPVINWVKPINSPSEN